MNREQAATLSLETRRIITTLPELTL